MKAQGFMNRDVTLLFFEKKMLQNFTVVKSKKATTGLSRFSKEYTSIDYNKE